MKNIKTLVVTIEYCGDSACDDAGLIEHETKNDGNVTTAKN